MSTRSPVLRSKLKKKFTFPVGSKQNFLSVSEQGLTTIQVDLIKMDDYPADSCAISHTAFFLLSVINCRYAIIFHILCHFCLSSHL